MLELRPSCERCSKPLPPNAPGAMICSYECTFCEACALSALRNVCPNCGGKLQHRPIPPRAMLAKHRASTERCAPHVDQPAYAAYLDGYRTTPPNER
jgi:hypothetical protein